MISMPKWLVVLAFVLGAALFWGLYAPLVHRGATALHSNLRAFLFVGVAYFIVAVLLPLVMIFVFNWDPTAKGQPTFESTAVMWGLSAGLAGALGALCLIFALTNAGGAIYVAPLVFGGAPIVNTIATLYIFNTAKTAPDWRFFTGIGLAVVGAAMVMVFRPEIESHAAPAPTASVAPAEASAPAH
jgi:uncharacterized membrane protein